MGKQSARMVYQRKDHKDIYFRGKYHDAMYVGSELVWHKIRQEGYYVFIYVNPSKEMVVTIFDENTGNVQKVLEVIKNPESDASFVTLMSITDGERIYLSTLGDEALIAASIDGIHYGNTNLNVIDNMNMFAIGRFHFSYKEEKEGVISTKNCMWGPNIATGLYGYVILKYVITLNDNVYSLEKKHVETRLTAGRIDSDRIEETNNFITPETQKSKIAWHVRYYREKTDEKRVTYAVKYYNVETETSGEIVEFNYGVTLTHFCCINGVYMFFVRREIDGEKWGEKIFYLYIYYSFDGIKYESSLIEEKYTKPGEKIAIPESILYRMGMYYIYCLPENNTTGSPNVVRLTADFKHFSKKYIPQELEIDGKTFDTVNGFKPFEKALGNEGRTYFCNGEMCTPEDGIVGFTKIGTVYIDNMFFRKSSGNKIITLP